MGRVTMLAVGSGVSPGAGIGVASGAGSIAGTGVAGGGTSSSVDPSVPKFSIER